jgi:hypothetical protein
MLPRGHRRRLSRPADRSDALLEGEPGEAAAPGQRVQQGEQADGYPDPEGEVAETAEVFLPSAHPAIVPVAGHGCP